MAPSAKLAKGAAESRQESAEPAGRPGDFPPGKGLFSWND
jgi:hypothetical protein